MSTLLELETQLAEQRESKRAVQAEIKKQTQELHAKSDKIDNEIKATERSIANAASEFYDNDENHIFDRYNAWLKYSSKGHSEWIISDGPLRRYLDSGCMQRYQTIDVLDNIVDLMYNIKTVQDFDNFEDDRSWASIADSEELTELLEDVIRNDVDSFVWDW